MNNVKFKVIIPARMSSTRLPGKMLADICGQPLIIRVANQAKKTLASEIIVATDDKQIYDVCQKHQITAILTRVDHQSGTDRIAEVAQILNLAEDEIIINIQGDEPLIEPKLVNDLAKFIHDKDTPIATVAHAIHNSEDIFNPNIVKTVLDSNQIALYFSRAPIPYYRDGYSLSPIQVNQTLPVLRHIGIYAYKVKFLNLYAKLNPCALEQIESLEQLRAIYYGYKIALMQTNEAPAIGVDTQADLDKVRAIISQME